MTQRTCSADGCDAPHHARGLCSSHYAKWRRNRDHPDCSVSECERPQECRGWCKMHYQRWLTHGDPTFVKTYPAVCQVEGCDRPHRAKGLCSPHHKRWRRFGTTDPQPLGSRGPRPHMRGANNPSWAGDKVSYHGMHARLRKIKGDPTGCEFCRSADAYQFEWALRKDARDVLTDQGSGLTYSLDPDDYIALCTSCHRGYDLTRR